MSRYFTLTQAERLLPQVEQEMRRALELYATHRELEGSLQETLRRITMLGGAQVDREGIGGARAQLDQTATQVNEIIEGIQSLGCQVKDLETGLVDFPTLYRGDEVLLCWRFGEDGISFWHGLEEGFRGRKRIDRDFLENHSGESVQ